MKKNLSRILSVFLIVLLLASLPMAQAFAAYDCKCGTYSELVLAQFGGTVTCDSVEGDVKAGGSVTCDNIEGNVTAGANVTCDTIGGSVTGVHVECESGGTSDGNDKFHFFFRT